ncbi:hypothetical protein [Tunicatimonas pelagia]|uniref:hypothetical protein n=1 Tax=Tunicatimonas pelagia TaxID=931531 RepID=UPI002666EFFB|nr:hypothetical protein [Tunicatimonas pelagia]WKN46040.1 hypothetical protein P0M28_13880 [Tunicatimonas pelagia]
MRIPLILTCSLFFSFFYANAQNEGIIVSEAVEQQIQKLSKLRTTAEKNDDLESFLTYYHEDAISMPEYQPTLTGIDEITAFYQQIFRQQDISILQRTAEEVVRLDSTFVEIGVFSKEYTDLELDTTFVQNGKYWNVWGVRPDSSLVLKGESYGFFHPVEHPEALTVELPAGKSSAETFYFTQHIPLELRAYNALNEKYVSLRSGELRSEFYTDDAKFMPFQEPTVSGIDEIKPYLIQYNQGDVTIDSIAVYTYHYEATDDHILEYSKFRVKWTVPNFSGRTEGKGIRIWQRQADHSLRMYRNIGTHNHLD